jgi:hypothetical protein
VIAELRIEVGFLPAAFSFFSRTVADPREDSSSYCFMLTLPKFCLSIPKIRTYVEDVVGLYLNIVSLSLDTQLRKLIIQPLSHFHDGRIVVRYTPKAHSLSTRTVRFMNLGRIHGLSSHREKQEMVNHIDFLAIN